MAKNSVFSSTLEVASGAVLGALGVVSGFVGAAIVDAFLQKYGNDNTQENMRRSGTSDISHSITASHSENITEYSHRAKSLIVKWMISRANIKISTIAEYLGCQEQSFRNKLARDSFSFDDLIIIAKACNCDIQIKDNNVAPVGAQTIFTISAEAFFDGYNEEVIGRIKTIEEEKRESRKNEYEQMKALIEQYEKEYGFK